jgi:protein phosphatase methylesterase 1
MPGQICDKSGVLAASLVPRAGEEGSEGPSRPARAQGDAIQEEGEEGDMEGPSTTAPPAGHLSWRVDLASSEPHWADWFRGLSARFLEAPAAKLLLLAGVDRLDRELTVGQMQGKFQMQVLPAVGHTVHEDSPDRVAEVLATFLVRNKLATATEAFQPAGLFGAGVVPGGVMGPPAGLAIRPAARPSSMGPPAAPMGPPAPPAGPSF